MTSERNVHTCENGHRFEKTGDRPAYPICEAEREPERGFLSALPSPARRALENEGITTVSRLAEHSEAEILALHGMGPSSLSTLNAVLEERGLAFGDE